MLPVWGIPTELPLVHISTHEFHIATPTFNLLFMFHGVLKNKGPAFVAELWELCGYGIVACIWSCLNSCRRISQLATLEGARPHEKINQNMFGHKVKSFITKMMPLSRLGKGSEYAPLSSSSPYHLPAVWTNFPSNPSPFFQSDFTHLLSQSSSQTDIVLDSV